MEPGLDGAGGRKPGPGSEEGDGAGDEVREVAAAEEAVAQQGQVDELAHYGLTGGVVADEASLVGAGGLYLF